MHGCSWVVDGMEEGMRGVKGNKEIRSDGRRNGEGRNANLLLEKQTDQQTQGGRERRKTSHVTAISLEVT